MTVRCLRGVRAAGARLWARWGGRTEQIFKWSRGSGNCGPGKGQEMPLEAREGRAGWLLVSWFGPAHWPGPGSQAVPSSETRNNGLAWGGHGGLGLAWDPLAITCSGRGSGCWDRGWSSPFRRGPLPSRISQVHKEWKTRDGDAVCLSVSLSLCLCFSGIRLALDDLC